MPAPQDPCLSLSSNSTQEMWAGWDSVQNARLLGSYQPNNSLIRLNRDASFWSRPDDEHTLRRYATFAHEYAHYLHNYSTVAGITDFCCHLQTAYFFISANNPQGRCQGSQALSTKDLKHYQDLIALQLHIRGNLRRPPLSLKHGDHAQYRTLRLTTSEFSSSLLAQPMQRIDVAMEVTSPQAEPVEITLQLGYLLIDEAIAYSLEKIIFERAGVSTRVLEASTPTFPYKIAETLIRECTKVSPTAEQTLIIGLLALQSADCGATFKELLRHLTQDPAGFAQTLDRLTRETVEQLDKQVSDMFKLLVNPSAASFSKLLGDGVQYHKRLCEDYLRQRVNEPFFELAIADIRPNQTDRFRSFMDRFPPCPIIEEGSDVRDLLYLSSQPPSAKTVQAIAAFQSFGIYQRWHSSRTGLVPTKALPPLACGFHGCCSVPFALAHPDVCQTRPWDSYEPSQSQLCWFATAVAHARKAKPGDDFSMQTVG